MTNIFRRTAWLAAFAALALAGAGCAPSEPTQPSMPQEPSTPPGQITPPPASNQPESSEQNMPPASTSTSSVLPPIDSTWKTYTNATLKISFKYPTTGIYTPTWGVTVLKPTDAKLVKGCYQGDANQRQEPGTLLVGDTNFCVTRYEDAGAGQRYETDYYTATVDGSVVLITFSKHLSVGDNYDDPACHGQLVVNVGNACKPVDLGVYNAALDQIVSTFTHS